MTDFTIRSDNVDVEQIMRQIRMRIKEKRGADYTEEEVRELASVKLEKFLNPRAVRSDLIKHYQRQRTPATDTYEFDDGTIYRSHRAPVLERIRRLLNPVLKLFFNPNPIIMALHKQAKINTRHDEIEGLNYEVLNNIVLELTRVTIEVKNLKMRVESMAARQDFNERRARAFEGVVQYKPPTEAPPGEESAATPAETEEGEARRRRRRRRGRRRPGTDAASRQDEGAPAPEGEGAAAPQREEAAPSVERPPGAPAPRPEPGSDQ